jgi:hypothetical protein
VPVPRPADTEDNRTAGPPVRALDRYTYSIVGGHLILGSVFSVAKVRHGQTPRSRRRGSVPGAARRRAEFALAVGIRVKGNG